jgi:hypothetical protein
LSFRASRSSAARNDDEERNPEDADQTMLIQGISTMVLPLQTEKGHIN